MRVNRRNVAYFASCNSHVDKSGSLQKFSESKGTYQTKWCVLKGNILFYFDKNGDREPQGAIVLEGCRIELADTVEGLHAFQLSFSGNVSKDYRLVADTPEAMESWMKALSCATYDYMKAVVDELQRQMDEISHHEGGDLLMTEDEAEGGDGASAANGEIFAVDGAASAIHRKSGAIVRATFPSEKGSTLKSAAFPNPLYDVLDEVPNTLAGHSAPQESSKDNRVPVFIVNRDSSESDSEDGEEGTGDSTSSESQYANLDPASHLALEKSSSTDFENATYMSASLEDLSNSNPNTFRSLSHNLTHSDTDLTAAHYTEKETLPVSKSALQLPSRSQARKKRAPVKPPRLHSVLYENMAGFATGLNKEVFAINQKLSDFPNRASSKFFHRAKSSESLKTTVERGRSVFHVGDVRSFAEMHEEFGVLIVKKINEFRQKRCK